MTQRIEITWELEDGYAGGRRPHHTRIDLDDLDMTAEEFEKLTDAERAEAVREFVQEDFEQTISWFVDHVELAS